MKKGGRIMKKETLQNWWNKTEIWMRKISRRAVHETRTLTWRAQETGQLTALGARKYRCERELSDHYAQLGKKVLELMKEKPTISVAQEGSLQDLLSTIKEKKDVLDKLEQEI